MSLSVATGTDPVTALGTATEQLQDAGSAQDEGRRSVFRGRTVDEESRTPEDVQIAHFDVNDATEEYTDQLNEFDTFIAIEQGYAELMRYMRRAHDSLSFFVGGDNVIAVCPALEPADYDEAVAHVRNAVEVDLKVGVGRGIDARDAGMAAKHALEDCRATGADVRVDWRNPEADAQIDD